MIRKAILGTFILLAAVFLIAENSFAQGHPIPGEMGGLLGVGNRRNSSPPPVTNNNNVPRYGRYTPAQVYQIRAQILQYDNQIYQWIQYRNERVLPFYNHPAYYQWARSEFQRANQAIFALQQNKLYYQSLLWQAGFR